MIVNPIRMKNDRSPMMLKNCEKSCFWKLILNLKYVHSLTSKNLNYFVKRTYYRFFVLIAELWIF
jgi:hypothetical protein